jgi:hypothetical protein
MSKLCAWFLASALLVPSLARAEPIQDCTSAFNYAANTSAYFVTAVFARVARGSLTREAAHTGLDRPLTAYAGRRVYESDELESCHLRGLWHGLVAQLSIEYARCGGTGEFACLDRLMLARHARTVLRSMASWTDLTSERDDVLTIFEGEDDGTGVPWCDSLPVVSCAEILLQETVYEPLIGAVALAICGTIEEEPVTDAGAGDGGTL